MKSSDILVVASRFRVFAFQKATGERIWETVLVSGFFNIGESFVTLVLDETAIYAHTKNQLFCLDLLSGRIIWQKDIPALGRDVASLALGGSGVPAVSATMAQIASRRKSDGGGD